MIPRVFLVTLVDSSKSDPRWGEELNREMCELARSANLDVINPSPFIQKIRRMDPKTFLTKGILDLLFRMVSEQNPAALLFSRDFSPAQQKNLSAFFASSNLRIITKTDLIYEIFLKRASTAPSKIQIELANLKYLRTRLVGSYEGYDRIRGGVGIKGPGETKLEIDRRSIEKRIHRLTKELAKYESHARMLASSRKGVPSIALVGYTNAGKSTLMNLLTGGNQLAENLLFSTVDVKSRKMDLSPHRSVVVKDTIGFIRELPPYLIESFKTTLLEISYSQLLLLVVDATSPFREVHAVVVRKILSDLGCSEIPRILVYNKMDMIPEGSFLAAEENCVRISAKTGEGVDVLKQKIRSFFSRDFSELNEGIVQKGKDFRP
jgi:GTP-binding protein HflX